MVGARAHTLPLEMFTLRKTIITAFLCPPLPTPPPDRCREGHSFHCTLDFFKITSQAQKKRITCSICMSKSLRQSFRLKVQDPQRSTSPLLKPGRGLVSHSITASNYYITVQNLLITLHSITEPLSLGLDSHIPPGIHVLACSVGSYQIPPSCCHLLCIGSWLIRHVAWWLSQGLEGDRVTRCGVPLSIYLPF